MKGRKHSLFAKIIIIPVVAAVSLVLSLAINTVTTESNRVLLEDAELTQFPLLQLAEKNLIQLERIRDTLEGAVTTGDEEMLESAQSMTSQLHDDLKKSARILPSQGAALRQIEDDLNDYTSLSETVTRDMIAGTADFSTLGQKIGTMNKSYDAALQGLTTFRDSRLQNFTQAMGDAKTNASNAIYYGIAVGVIAIVILFGTAIPVSRSIVHSVNTVVNTLRDIAQEDGDLTVRLQKTSNDEIGDLVYWFNTFADKLQDVIGQIVSTVSPLTDLANTLDNFVSDTLTTVESQKGSSRDVMTSSKEINASVAQVSEHANDAADTASQTASIAQEGQQSIMCTVDNIEALSRDISASAETITELDETAKSVSMVIGVIKNIAEQTNLLALNAAIEAARAGEQGRGFAVVADEVRSLASKTQQSTDEIQQTIEALESGTRKAVSMMEFSTEKTNECVTSVNEAGSRFEAIMENINRNHEINSEIAASTDAQQQLSQSLQTHAEEIRDGAEQSHSATNKLAENISHLAQLSHSLKAVSDQFKV